MHSNTNQNTSKFSSISMMLTTVLSCVFFLLSFGTLRAENVLKVAITLPLAKEDLDPNKSFYTAHDIVMRPMFDRLISFDSIGTFITLGAEHVDYSEDGLSVTIRIKQGQRWSNGDEVTAYDYVRGLQRATAEDSETREWLASIANLNLSDGDGDEFGAIIENDYAFTLTLDEPFSFSIDTLTMMFASPIHESDATSSQNRINTFKTNGPFMIASIEENQIVLERNPYYTGEKSEIDRIEFVGFAHDEAVDLYLSGKADVLLGPLGPQQAWLREKYPDEVIEVGFPRIYVVILNSLKPPLNDPAVRKAMSAALDRDFFGDDNFFSNRHNIRGVLPVPIMATAERNEIWQNEDTAAARIKAAREMLSAAGYGVDNKLKLSLLLVPTVHGYEQISNFLKSNWAPIDIEIKLFTEDQYTKAISMMRAGDYDAMIGSYYGSSPKQYLASPLTPDSNMPLFFEETEKSAELLKALSRTDYAELSSVAVAIEDYIHETAYVIPILHADRLGFRKTYVKTNQSNTPMLFLRYFELSEHRQPE